MEKENAVIPSAAAPTNVVPPTNSTEDAEAQVARLQAEKTKLLEENANWKAGLLKEKAKNKVKDDDTEESTEDMVRRISRETLSESRLVEIAQEQDSIIQRALKENKELKLAQLNKTGAPPASVGTHSESQPVTDTLITPDQLNAFKARGWTDKDIERYKKLQRGGR